MRRPVRVVSTVARQSIGMVTRETFIEGVHEECDRIWGKLEGCCLAGNQMQWLIQKVQFKAAIQTSWTMTANRRTSSSFQGDHVQYSQPITHPLCEVWDPLGERSLEIRIRFCQSQADTPPRRKTDSVTALCSMNCRIDVPYQSLEDHRAPNGKILKKGFFEVRMIPSGATVEFSVFHRGELLESRDVKVEFE